MWSVYLLLSVSLLLFCFPGLVVWPANSCLNFLGDFITDRLHSSQYYFRVCTNNVTPSSTSILTDFTEAAWGGYSPILGSSVTWGAPALAGVTAGTTGSNLVFNNTTGSAVTLYGVYVTDGSIATKLYFCERDANAPVSVPAGGSYIYTPNQQFRSMN